MSVLQKLDAGCMTPPKLVHLSDGEGKAQLFFSSRPMHIESLVRMLPGSYTDPSGCVLTFFSQTASLIPPLLTPQTVLRVIESLAKQLSALRRDLRMTWYGISTHGGDVLNVDGNTYLVVNSDRLAPLVSDGWLQMNLIPDLLEEDMPPELRNISALPVKVSKGVSEWAVARYTEHLVEQTGLEGTKLWAFWGRATNSNPAKRRLLYI